MRISKYLSSLRSTYIFMLCFGLFMGGVFPFYSALFFGTKAFHPLYVVGCLAAGVLVGSFCYYIIKQVLKLYLQRQWQTLSAIAGKKGPAFISAEDELKSLLECYDILMSRVLGMVENVSTLIARIIPMYHQLTNASRQMVVGNETQVDKVREVTLAVEKMNGSFGKVLKEVEDLTRRTEEKASISAEMSATTDAIADNIKQYSSAVLEISASIEEMALSLRETTSNVEGLAASAEQTTSSVTEISSSIAHVHDNAQQTAEHSDKVRRQAQEGILAMTATLKTMREIEASSEESYGAINRLSTHTARVGEFLNVINDVVEQTNLLSLNASIIAAQAGVRGKAFAVVAEEVRALAHRTSASTKEIEELVKNIQKESAAVQRTVTQGKDKVSAGVKISSTANESLMKIEASAAEASQMVKKIAGATLEQAAASKLITEETEKNLGRVKQLSKAIQEQEKGAALIVHSLENMRDVSQQIASATQEHSRGNRLYLKSVLEDNEKVKSLKDTSLQQLVVSERVATFVREAGSLIEANAEEAKQIVSEIESIHRLTDKLKQELEPFRADQSVSGFPVSG